MLETETAPDVDEAADDDEDECTFDVQAWAEAYLADLEAQAEHARLPGVPFH